MAADVTPADKIITIAGRRFVTAAVLAQVLGVTPRTLARWHKKEVGPPRAQVGRTILHDLDKLSDWLAARESEPAGRRQQTEGPDRVRPSV